MVLISISGKESFVFCRILDKRRGLDIELGSVNGFSSILTLMSTIVVTKQNHKHELDALNQNHTHQINVIEQNHAYDLKIIIQKIALENSLRDYEIKTNLINELSAEGQTIKIYPYDMYLVTYMHIAQYMVKGNFELNDLPQLLSEMNFIKDQYDFYQE